MVKRLNSVDRL